MVMVEVKMTMKTQGEQIAERRRKVNAMRTRPGLRVEPANDDMRRLLKHPRAGGFRAEGSLEWPDDVFTQRRLRDGDIRLVVEHEETKQASKGRAGHDV